jgi:hypothetical protein
LVETFLSAADGLPGFFPQCIRGTCGPDTFIA